MKIIRRRFSALVKGAVDSQDIHVKLICTTMINALDKFCSRPHTAIAASIIHAADLETLWYLRSGLFHAISCCTDQVKAGSVLDEITLLFEGHLAVANSTRIGSGFRGVK
jgi:hypothetical protein